MALSRLTIDLGVGLAGFESDLGRAARITDREIRKIESQASRLAKRAGALLGASLAGGFIVAVKAASDFEKSMAEVATLLDDTSSLDSLTESVKDLSKEFGQAPTEEAKALYQIISAGAEAGAESIEILTQANKLAVGGLTDVKTAADGLTSVLNAYGLSAGDAANVTDVMFETMRLGKTTIGEISSGLGNVVSIAAQAGVEFEELQAVLATASATGINTSQAYDGFRGVLQALLKQSDQTVEAAKELGIQFDLSRLRAAGFSGVLNDIITSSQFSEERLSRLVGRVEGLTNILSVAREGGEKFTENLEKIRDSAGAADEAVAKIAATVDEAFNRLKSAVAVELIETGDLEGLAGIIDTVTENVDFLANSVKALAGLFVGALVVSIIDTISKLDKLVRGVAAARIAMVGMLGVLGLIAAAMASVVTAYQRIQEIMRDASQDIVRSTELLYGQAAAFREVGDAAALAGLRQDLNARLEETADHIKDLQEELSKARAEQEEFFDEQIQGLPSAISLNEKIESLELSLANARKVQAALTEEMRIAAPTVADLAGEIGNFVDEIIGSVDASESAADALKALEKAIDGLEEHAKKAREELNEMVSIENQVRAMVDALDPAGAAFRRFNEMARFAQENAQLFAKYGLELADVLELIDLQAREAILGIEGFGNASGEATSQVVSDTELMREAVLEGVRQITDAFLSMWQNILLGAENSFDGIKDAFAALIGNLIHSATTQKIQLQFEEAFGPGGGGLESIDFKELGKSFGAIAAAEFSDDVIQGLFGDSSTDQYVKIGQQIGTAVGAVIGSIFPVIGTALGAALGSIAGSIDGLIFGKLFGRDFEAVLGGVVTAVMANAASDAQRLKTALGEVIGISGQGGFGDLNNIDTPGGQIGQAIQAFDQAIFDILTAAEASEELNQIVEALATWKGQLDDGANDVEALLQSRFATILSAMSDDVRTFTQMADDIESQVARFGVGLSAEKLFEALPQAFEGSSILEFLEIVEQFQDGLGTLTDAFNEVVNLLSQIVGITDSLKAFSTSNLESDFAALVEAQNRSIGQALARVNSQLFDAVANFDGSVESLQEIAGLVATVREGEIRYLSQLDSLQKGLNANLDDLRADILGLTAPTLDVDALLGQAQALIGQVSTASSAEEVAALQQQFSAILRSIDTEDATFRQVELLGLVDSFQDAANAMIEQFRANALDSADSVRTLVGDFITDIGTPLDILVASNERIASAVEALSGTGADEFVLGDRTTIGVDAPIGGVANEVISANNTFATEIDSTMRNGLDNIAMAVERGRHDDAQAIVDAIRNAQFPVTVVIEGDGFNTQ